MATPMFPHPEPRHTTPPASNEFDGPCRPCSPPSTPQAPKDSALIRYSAAPTAIPPSGEPDPTPPSKTDTSTPIFRVTGIPLGATQQDLMGVLMSEFATKGNILPLASRLVCCQSCYDGRTQTALLEFAPARVPSVLLDFLDDGVNKGYMISYPSGGDIAIDQDFYGLTQLYPTCHPIKADIVAVCDLGQHAYRSWSGEADNRGIERMWLRDFLQEDLPSCRTMIYGYDSRLRGACGLREVPDYKDVLLEELRKARRAPEEKNRPIIFIGHGFGGMLIAEAVVQAKANTDRYGALFESTKATIFYAIPDLAQVVDDILRMIGDDSTRGDLVNSIRRRSEGELRNFVNCSSSHGTRIINYKAVDQSRSLTKGGNGDSAKTGDLFNAAGQEPGVPHIPDSIEDTLIIDGDHSTLVKFQYKAQLSYTSVLMHLEECTNNNNTELLGQDMTAEIAIKSGTYDDLVRVLQTTTVDINAPLNHVPGAPTLLQIATSAGSIRKVTLLIEKGAIIGARNGYGSTALHEAIASKNVKLVELLLQNGGKNQPLESCAGNYNWMYELPLLHFACAESNREIVEILVKAGDTGLEDCAGDMNHRPLHFAAVNKDSSVLQMLAEEKKVDTELRDKLQKTALHLAAISGLARNTRLLLSHGAKIEARDIPGGTPLQIAVESENEEVVDMLLGNGADIAAPGANGNTPLHAACAGRNEKIAKKLLDRETDIEKRNTLGLTPLLCAACSGSKSIFELLVRKKADVTAVDKQCRTLLHIAAGNMNEDLVELIVSYGADVEARDANEVTPLLAAVKKSNAAVVKSLLKNGASTASTNKEGKTPLHIAITKGSYEIIKHLLDHKADVEARGKLEDTPLHIAAKNGNERIIALLLEYRADRKARNRLLMRPIDVARRQEKMACARLLKEGSPGSEGRE